jgi:uncharacterized Rmd1/YagE family protein
MEEMPFFVGGHPRIECDSIILPNTADSRTLVKQQLAFSYGMVRSVILDSIESLLETSLERMKTVPSDLETGRLPSDKVLSNNTFAMHLVY